MTDYFDVVITGERDPEVVVRLQREYYNWAMKIAYTGTRYNLMGFRNVADLASFIYEWDRVRYSIQNLVEERRNNES